MLLALHYASALTGHTGECRVKQLTRFGHHFKILTFHVVTCSSVNNYQMLNVNVVMFNMYIYIYIYMINVIIAMCKLLFTFRQASRPKLFARRASCPKIVARQASRPKRVARQASRPK